MDLFEDGRTYEFRLVDGTCVSGIVDLRETKWAYSGHPMVLGLKLPYTSERTFVPWHAVVTYVKG